MCNDHDEHSGAESPSLAGGHALFSMHSGGAAHLDSVAVAVLGVTERLNKGERDVVRVKSADVAWGGHIAGVEQCLEAVHHLHGQKVSVSDLASRYCSNSRVSRAIRLTCLSTAGIAAQHGCMPNCAGKI